MWSHRVARPAVSKQLCYSNVAFQADVTWDFSPQSVPRKTETWPDSSPLTGRSLHSVGFKRKVDGLVILRRALQSSTPFHQCLVLKVPSCILKGKFPTLRQLTAASYHKRATRTHTLVKSKILICRRQKEAEGSWPWCNPTSISPEINSLFRPTLAHFNCQVAQLPTICSLSVQMSSSTISDHHLQLWFQALLRRSKYKLSPKWNQPFALPGPWCSCLHATWCTRRLEWSAPTPAIRNLGASHCWHPSCSSYRGEMVVNWYIVNVGPCVKCWSQFYQRSCQSSPNQLPTQFGLREN